MMTLRATPQHLLRAIDRYLAPAASATTVSGVAWSVTNMNGAADAIVPRSGETTRALVPEVPWSMASTFPPDLPTEVTTG